MSNKSNFKPYVPAKENMKELTKTSVILGIILAVVFSGANAYLGLRVGLTVSASIPAAVISMGVIRYVLKRDSILENNMVQTIGSAGESIAAGAIFTMPALFMWLAETNEVPSLLEITLLSLCGGILGVLFMIPLRRALIVEEHETLPFPEATACAEVLIAGDEQGAESSIVFKGLGISALFKFITDGLKIFPSEVHYENKQTGFGVDILPSLLGVGYICGYKISAYMMGGGILAWLVIIPLLKFFGGDGIIFPSTVAIAELDSFGVWSSYIRYIGAGAVAAGGILSLIKSLPLIIKTFRQAIGSIDLNKGSNNKEATERTSLDLSMKTVLITIIAFILIIWLVPAVPVTFIGAFLIVIFGFFFATVSSRLVGLVGSSNNPVSGMTIATLLISATILKLTGSTALNGMIGSIAIGSIICTVAAIAGDTSQDLKTGFIVGATPKKQQIGQIFGVIASSLTIGWVLYLLNLAWGFGSAELPAPQAALMKLVVEGVMGGNLPWILVLVGAAIAVMIEILGIPVLPFCIGIYLPIHLSAGIMAGGLVRAYVEKKKHPSDKEKDASISRGMLYTSGMIAGEGIVGILLALLAILPFGSKTVADAINLSGIINIGSIGGIIMFLLLAGTVLWTTKNRKK